jgi:NAD(P)-dependent dehydrogenase (short-subunit alcohol dehydrogenase family)
MPQSAKPPIRMRLKDKIAIVVGAGQSPGEGLGNGHATVLRFAQEGAKVLAVDNNFSSAEETVAMMRQRANNVSHSKRTSLSRQTRGGASSHYNVLP